jgi:RHS repeat-associated protein
MRHWLISLIVLGVGIPSAATAQEQVRYYHTDLIGSVRMVTDENGVVTKRHDYMPFGIEWSPPEPVTERVLFAGEERDQETGFDYFGARYYGNQDGRFTTVDPLLDIEQALVEPQRWNRYTYTLNNPFKFTDPDGRDPRLITGGVGAAVYAAWNVYVNVQQGQAWYQNLGLEASKGFLVGATLGLAAPALAGTTAEMGLLSSGGTTIAGPLGAIARSELDKAMNAGGQTIELVTKLTQSPVAGRALSAAAGEGAQALAAASRRTGNLYMARIPEHTIKLLERAGLVTIRSTMMNGVRGIEYRFRPEAMEYLSRYFEEITQ